MISSSKSSFWKTPPDRTMVSSACASQMPDRAIPQARRQLLAGRLAQFRPDLGRAGGPQQHSAAADESPVPRRQKGNGYASVMEALRASCSTHIAACPSKVISRVNPSRAATVSKSRPIEVVEKVRTPLVTSSSSVSKSLGKVERRRGHVRQGIQLRQKARRGLHRVLRGGISAGKLRVAQMSDSLKAFC